MRATSKKENRFQLVHNGYINGQSISFETVHDLKEDREENLWVATNNNGLFRFNPGREFFQNVHHMNRAKNKPGEGSALCFMPDDNNTVLMGAWGNGIYRYDSSFNNIPLNIKGIPENNSVVVWSMHARPMTGIRYGWAHNRAVYTNTTGNPKVPAIMMCLRWSSRQ